MTKFITIASGKGGVGKTTVAINLSNALSDFGRSVILVDASIYTPDIGLYLGAPNVKKTFHDVLNNEAKIRDAIYSHPSGIRIVPGSISLDKARNADPGMIGNVIDGMRGMSEAVLIDCPSGLGKDAMAVIRAADYAIVVTQPDLPSVTDTLKTIKLAEKIGTNVIGVVVNRYSKSSELRPSNVGKLLDRPVIGVIPEDDKIKEALKLKHPVVYSYPDSESTIEFRRLASYLIGQPYETEIPQKEEKNFFTFMKGRFKNA